METPEYSIGTTVEVTVPSDYLRGEVIGIQYTYPVYMYIVQLDSPFEGEFGKQTGLYVPESILSPEPNVEPLSKKSVGQYVCLTDDGAIDVQVMVAHDENGWYVLLVDTIDGTQLVRFTPFGDESEAQEVAQTIIEENHEAAPGENAGQYLTRIAESDES